MQYHNNNYIIINLRERGVDYSPGIPHWHFLHILHQSNTPHGSPVHVKKLEKAWEYLK